MPRINIIIVTAERTRLIMGLDLGSSPKIDSAANESAIETIAAIIIINIGLYQAYVSRVAGNVVNSFSSLFPNNFDLLMMLNLLMSL